MPELVIVRYGELGLKSAPVRREFEHLLEKNILAQFLHAGTTCRLRGDHGHLYVEASDGDRAAALPRRVFGVTSVSPAVEVSGGLPSLVEQVPPMVAPRLEGHRTFAVRARRTGNHPFTSQDVGREVGGAIADRHPELRVDLDLPEVEIYVEVRGPKSYVYFEKLPGPGGLPLGVAGTVVGLVDGLRGALGTFMMMKRGCRARVVATPSGLAFAQEWLSRFDPKMVVVEAADSDAADASLQASANAGAADGVVLPVAVDEYAAARDRWGDRVVFSPTVGLTDEEVGERWASVVSLIQ